MENRSELTDHSPPVAGSFMQALLESSSPMAMDVEKRSRPLVGIIPGEGIGPEIIAVARQLLELLAHHRNLDLEIRTGGDIGAEVERKTGNALPADVEAFCESLFADGGTLLCGPGGGRFVYEFRKRFGLFCKFTPVRPLPELRDAGALRPEAVDGVDMVIVRENVSGLYFSECHVNDEEAVHTFRYRRREIEPLVRVAARLAEQRKGNLCLAVKTAAVNSASRLWRDIFDEVTSGTSLECSCLEVDNANYQLIANGRAFDVVVTPNMFGDILADGAALLLGSRGMSFSGNYTANGTAVYQTAHGAAYDLAGKDLANPVGQILTTALMLRESLGLELEASALELAVARVLGAHIRTADIASPGRSFVGTREMGAAVVAELEKILVAGKG